MTQWIPLATILSLTLLLTACGGTLDCDKPRVYQQAVPGKRIETPDGLAALPGEREMTIPQASPQAPAPPGECIDAPPTLDTNSSDS